DFSIDLNASFILTVRYVVDDGLSRGYTPAQLVSLFVGLERLEIQNQSDSSIEYFLEAIAEAKNLLNLKQKTSLARKKLVSKREN
ncbi:unnamed protein product, partial [marine sediment metagenome]